MILGAWDGKLLYFLNLKSQASRCDVLECRASEYCLQLCTLSNCGSLSCDAMVCDQPCYMGNCSSLTCGKTSARCKQRSGSELTCEADACTQSCFREECRLTCPLGGANCTQEARESSADVKCDKNVCEQQCSFGQCNMNRLSSVMPAGLCQRVCDFGTSESMTCNAKQCIQVCQDTKCAMTCPREAKSVLRSDMYMYMILDFLGFSGFFRFCEYYILRFFPNR